ncbi:hypothetical protein FACS1894141_2660 [Spirochaetia bacterium]|nr:hypothetical protein FACS1894141_2660 [Spirochaetia bacterium]
MTKQDKLNHLYAKILKIDENGKDFLINIITQMAATRGFIGAPAALGDMSDKNEPKTRIAP